MYLSPLGGIGKRNIIFIKAHVQEISIQNTGIKIKISNSFFFVWKYIYPYKIRRSQRIFFAGGNLLRNKTKGGKMLSREKSSEVDLTNQWPPRH